MYVEQTGEETLRAEFLESETVAFKEEVIEQVPELKVRERTVVTMEVTEARQLETVASVEPSVPVPVREIEASLADKQEVPVVDFVSVLEISNNQGKQNSVKISVQALQYHYCISRSPVWFWLDPRSEFDTKVFSTGLFDARTSRSSVYIESRTFSVKSIL